MRKLLPVSFLFFTLSIVHTRGATDSYDSIPVRTADRIMFLPWADTTLLPSLPLFQTALSGYELLIEEQSVSRSDVITIIDFSLPSDKERLWVIDLINRKVLYRSLVSHGRNSGNLTAGKFSNAPGSNASSPGFYATAETYSGKHGLSLRLDGLEPGINDNARRRSVVMHGAAYVSSEFIRNNGMLGRSHGCPALPSEISEEIIQTIKEGSCLFIYVPETEYISGSDILGKITSMTRNYSLLLPVYDLKPPVISHLSGKYPSGTEPGLSHRSMQSDR
jgi:hypothetical protein